MSSAKPKTPPKIKISTNGHLTPRALRFALAVGDYVMASGKPPAPPPEWKYWKRERFKDSIRAACLFLSGRDLEAIGPLVGRGKVGESITRQRIAQMVGDGVKFLLDRKFIKPKTA